MLPKVSIIIPVYNGEDFLSQAINSVLAQTYQNIEVIVVDDGSTDGTRQIIESYGKKIIAIHKSNGGVASALNVGIQHATGEYIAWLSHDDMFLPEKIVKQVKFFQENPTLSFCYSNYIVIDKDGNELRREKSPVFPKEETIKKLFISSYIHGCTTLIRKECFNKVGLFDESLLNCQDTEMWIRISDNFTLGYIDEYLIYSREHENQGSKQYSDHAEKLIFFYDKYIKLLGPEKLLPNKSISESNEVNWAKTYVWFGDQILKTRKWYRYAFQQYKKSWSKWNSIKNSAWIKIILVKILLFLQGDYMIVYPLIQDVRISHKKGNKRKALHLLILLFIKYPLNISVIYLFYKLSICWLSNKNENCVIY